MTGNYDSEEMFWKNIYTEEDAIRKIVWGATKENFNDNTPSESNFIATHLDIKPEDKVLDYGCGIGRLMKALSSKCDKIAGLDVSNPMICNSEAFLKDVDNAQAYLCDGVAATPSIPENSMDKIYSFIVLQHINKYKVFYILKTLRTYLAPGGTGLFQFPDLLANEHTWAGYAQNYMEYNEYQMASMHMWTEEEARFVFKLAGWNVVDVIREPHNVGQGVQSDFWVKAE